MQFFTQTVILRDVSKPLVVSVATVLCVSRSATGLEGSPACLIVRRRWTAEDLTVPTAVSRFIAPHVLPENKAKPQTDRHALSHHWITA